VTRDTENSKLETRDVEKFYNRKDMKKIRFGANFTIFILFFGVAVLEAIQSHNWLKSLFWLAIGIVFLVADNLRKKT
jgi:hypothetical protein